MTMRRRAAAIVIDRDRVAMIERRPGSELYYLIPGGAVEAGEDIAAAARREIAEELGLEISVGPLVAVVRRQGSEQYYYRATILGGEFGTGHGQEMRGLVSPERGTYEAKWLPIDTLLHRDVRPRSVCELILEAVACGWPAEPMYADD